MKLGAIDIGSNAVRLLITEVIENNSGGEFKKVAFVRIPLRLGQIAFTKHILPTTKITELEKTLTAFHNLLDVFEVKDYMACATAAMRELKNGPEVIEHLKNKTGINLNIIEGKKEAELIYNIHVAENLDPDKNYLYIDVGGGSTELTLFSENHICASNSFPIGTLKMLLNQVREADWEILKNWVKENLRDTNRTLVGIGTGGNINKIAKLSEKKETKGLSYNNIKGTLNYLSNFTLEERISKLKLNPDRADVIVPAAHIFLSIMKWAKITEVYVPRLGLADGIIHFLYEKHKLFGEKEESR